MPKILKAQAKRRIKRQTNKIKRLGRTVDRIFGKPGQNMAYYSSGKGVKYSVKRGMTSEKDAVLKTLNAFEKTKTGLFVKYIYSAKSRVIRGTDDLLPVKLSDDRVGWLTPKGKFIEKNEIRELLHNVDQTSPAAISDVSLLDAWDTMSESQKAKMADYLQDYDWDVFWDEIGSDDPDRDLHKATKAYFEFIDTIGKIMGW